MKLWMTRDNQGSTDLILFWPKAPRDIGQYGYYRNCSRTLELTLPEFKSLTGLALPRRGSKRQVEVSITIKDVKGDK